MNPTTRNPLTSLNILLTAVVLLALANNGFAQTTNQVLSLDGSDGCVSVPSASGLQNPTEITVEAWIYPTNIAGTGYFIMKSDDGFVNSARTYEISWQPGAGNNLVFNVFLGTSTWGSVGAPAPADRWVHVAGTYSSLDSSLRIYTNGVLASQTTMDASGIIPLNHQLLRQTTLPLVFGAEITHPLGFAAGRMDEVRIWNKARTPDEIYGARYCRLTGAEPNLTAYWTFDDGTANDLTGHGHNGTFSGNAQAEPLIGNDLVHAGVCGEAFPSRTATAIAILNNIFVVSNSITDGGYGYTNPPTVRIIGGGGSGAQSVAVVSNGAVIAVNVINAGYGYLSLRLAHYWHWRHRRDCGLRCDEWDLSGKGAAANRHKAFQFGFGPIRIMNTTAKAGRIAMTDQEVIFHRYYFPFGGVKGARPCAQNCHFLSQNCSIHWAFRV